MIRRIATQSLARPKKKGSGLFFWSVKRVLTPFLPVVCLMLGWVAAAPAEELNSRERRIAGAVDRTVRQAGARFQAGDFDESAARIRRAMKQVDAAMKVATPALYDALIPAMDRIETAHTLLELEGVMLPPFRRPERPDPEPEDEPGAGAEGMDEVSFVERVAPILVSRCGRCHVDRTRGDFSLASYAALMRGTPAGVVIFPGDVVASRLIETIETGDMPRGGGDVPEEELQTLKAWIAAGAKFDGQDPEGALSRDRSSPGDDATELSVQRPTGEETVSFASDVAPLLVDNCGGCHLEATQTQGGLRLDNFAQLMRGGDSGPIVTPGEGEDSLLVQKLRGTAGQQMPAGGRPPLSDDSIATIVTWIDEGASLDGADENQSLVVMSQLAWARSATTEEKSDRRAELAKRSLKLTVADGSVPEQIATEHFFVIGNAPAATIQRVAAAAEKELNAIRRTVPGPAGAEYFAGRATIFLMPRRYDYSEFAKMVEGRGIPSDWMAHWRFDGIDAYAAVIAGEGDQEEMIGRRLFGPLASLAIATRGREVPRWFAEGVGTALARQESPPSDRQQRQQLEEETAEAISVMGSGKRFLDGKLPPNQTDRIGAAVASSLLDRPLRRTFEQLLGNLDSETKFEDAFVQAFGLEPVDFLDRWLARPAVD